MAERTALLLALLLTACHRPEPPRRRAVEDAGAATTATPDAPGCGPRFAADDAVPVAQGTPEAPLRVEAACDEGALGVVWRAGGSAGWAIHPLRDGSRWRAGTWSVPLLAQGGAAHLAQGAVWTAVIARDQALTLLRGPAEGDPPSLLPTAVLARAWFNPQVLWVEGGRALLALDVRLSGAARAVWLLAMGAGAPSWAPLGAGALASTAAGTRALVTRVVTGADGLVSLRGQWVDAPAALRAMTAGRVVLSAAALGAESSVPLAHAGMEFATRATADGVVFHQAVIGAERGAAGVAFFAPGAEATVAPLPMIPGALGDVVGEGDGYTLHWWDERYVPRRRTVRGQRVAGESEGGPGAGSAFAALDAARGTRHLACGGAPWVVSVEGGSLRARREDCP